MSVSLISLLLIYQIKHFLADYPMQTPYMLGKFKEKNWALPLAAHCGVHALLTFIIVLAFTLSMPLAVGMAVFDFSIHFAMDRVKASPFMLGKYKAINHFEYGWYTDELFKAKMSGNLQAVAEVEENIQHRLKSNKYFWWSLGLDQLVHHVTHYIIIFVILEFV